MFENQIRAGAAVLDEYAPAGWRDRVDLETLSAGSTDHCPLAQAFAVNYRPPAGILWGNAFEYGKDQLIAAGVEVDSGETWLVAHGFEARPTNDDMDYARNYPKLTAEWRGYLRRDWA